MQSHIRRCSSDIENDEQEGNLIIGTLREANTSYVLCEPVTSEQTRPEQYNLCIQTEDARCSLLNIQYLCMIQPGNSSH